MSLHYSFWIPYQSAYCGCDSRFLVHHTKQISLRFMPYSISHSSSLRGEKHDKKYWSRFPSVGTGTDSRLPRPRLLFPLCEMFFFFFVRLYLSSLSPCRQRHTPPPLLNIARVSDVVIPMGRRVPPLLEFVTAVVAISSVSSSVPSLWRLPDAAVPAGHQRRRLASSMRMGSGARLHAPAPARLKR